MNNKLFETMSKANMLLDSEHMPKSYNEESTFYKVDYQPKNNRLQDLISGWQKYLQYDILDKNCNLIFNGCEYRLLNILHLINPAKIDDIVIFRIVKKNKKTDLQNIRYVCTQSDKKQLCANIRELNNHMDKKCQYIGRKINKEDFLNVDTSAEKLIRNNENV